MYLYTDKSKIQSRSRYLVVSVDGEWCLIKTFSGRHHRASFYKVKLTECYTIPVSAAPHQNKANTSNDDNEPDMHDQYTTKNYPKQIVDPRPDRPDVPHILICENLDDLENAEGPHPKFIPLKLIWMVNKTSNVHSASAASLRRPYALKTITFLV